MTPTGPSRTGTVTNTFGFTFHPNLTLQQQGSSDPLLLESQVRLGTVLSGGGYTVTTDANQLNNNQVTTDGKIDNSASTAYTRILSDNYRPDNGNTVNPVTVDAWDLISGNVSKEQIAALMNITNQGTRILAPTDPLVLDLNGDGVKLTDYGSSPISETLSE